MVIYIAIKFINSSASSDFRPSFSALIKQRNLPLIGESGTARTSASLDFVRYNLQLFAKALIGSLPGCFTYTEARLHSFAFKRAEKS